MDIIVATRESKLSEMITHVVQEIDPPRSCTNAIFDPGQIFACLQNNNPELLVLDVEYYRRLQGYTGCDYLEVPVLLVLASDRELFLPEGILSGNVVEFLVYPASESEIKARIASCLRKLKESSTSYQGIVKCKEANEKWKHINENVAGSLLHDLKNVLTMLTGNASLARLYLTSGEKEKLEEKIKYIEEASEQARALIQNTLSYERLNKEKVCLKTLVEETVHVAAGDSSANIYFEFAENLDPVSVDVNAIKRVINNIIVNALQAIPENGEVRIRAENAEVKHDGVQENYFLHPGPLVVLSIGDNGSGIPDDRLERIFEPFFTTKEGGNGLGLTSSYYIVKKHGGDIRVKSKEGEGTTFQVYLPVDIRE